MFTKTKTIYLVLIPKCQNYIFINTFLLIFIPLHKSNSSTPLLYKDSHRDFPHCYPKFPAFLPLLPLSHSCSPHSCPDFPHSNLDSPYLHHFQTDSRHSHHFHQIPHIPIILLIPFPDSPFRILQIAK